MSKDATKMIGENVIRNKIKEIAISYDPTRSQTDAVLYEACMGDVIRYMRDSGLTDVETEVFIEGALSIPTGQPISPARRTVSAVQA